MLARNSRLVLAGDLELPALVLDLLEQPRVLDRQRRLGGERLQQRRPSSGAKSPGVRAADHERADDLAPRAAAARPAARGSPPRSRRPRARLGTAPVHRRCRRPATGCAACMAACPTHRLAQRDAAPLRSPRSTSVRHTVGGAQLEDAARLVVLVDRAAVGPGELRGARHDGVEHAVRSSVELTAWLDLAQRGQLLHRAGQLRVRACSSENSRTFSIAITAWSAKVCTSSICLSVNGRRRGHAGQR